jgi:hypothetical protein
MKTSWMKGKKDRENNQNKMTDKHTHLYFSLEGSVVVIP